MTQQPDSLVPDFDALELAAEKDIESEAKGLLDWHGKYPEEHGGFRFERTRGRGGYQLTIWTSSGSVLNISDQKSSVKITVDGIDYGTYPSPSNLLRGGDSYGKKQDLLQVLKITKEAVLDWETLHSPEALKTQKILQEQDATHRRLTQTTFDPTGESLLPPEATKNWQ